MKRVTFALGLILVTAVGALVAGIQDETSEAGGGEAGNYGRGFGLFQRYCRTCHGSEAKGDGHIAQWLKVPPADLTMLSARNDGEFPLERVRAVIDGREEVRTHGRREMPVWGEVFLEPPGDTAAEEAVESKVDDLIAYLRGIQVEGDGGEADGS